MFKNIIKYFNQYKVLQIIDYILGKVFLIFIPLIYIFKFKFTNYKNYKDRIVVVKLLGGGTLLKTFPVLLEIKKKFPTKKFILIGTKQTISFAKTINLFDEVNEISFTSITYFFKTSFKVFKKNLHSEFIINLESNSNLMIIFCFFMNSKTFISFYRNNIFAKILLKNKIYEDHNQNIFDSIKKLLSFFGIDFKQSIFDKSYDFLINKCGFNKHSKIKKGVISISNFSSGLGPEREFSNNDFSILINRKYLKEVQTIKIFGSSEDLEKSYELTKYLKLTNKKINIINYVGKFSLKKSIQEILKTDKFISIDSGLNNFLVLLKMDIDSYWGPTNPYKLLIPFNKNKSSIFYSNLVCSPCIHNKIIPPCKGDNLCMKSFTSKIDFNLVNKWKNK